MVDVVVPEAVGALQDVQTIYEVAADLKCSPRKVAAVAKDHNIGMNLKGSAGWRFTAADRERLKLALRPAPVAPAARRRKRSRVR